MNGAYYMTKGGQKKKKSEAQKSFDEGREVQKLLDHLEQWSNLSYSLEEVMEEKDFKQIDMLYDKMRNQLEKRIKKYYRGWFT